MYLFLTCYHISTVSQLFVLSVDPESIPVEQRTMLRGERASTLQITNDNPPRTNPIKLTGKSTIVEFCVFEYTI